MVLNIQFMSDNNLSQIPNTTSHCKFFAIILTSAHVRCGQIGTTVTCYKTIIQSEDRWRSESLLQWEASGGMNVVGGSRWGRQVRRNLKRTDGWKSKTCAYKIKVIQNISYYSFWNSECLTYATETSLAWGLASGGWQRCSNPVAQMRSCEGPSEFSINCDHGP